MKQSLHQTDLMRNYFYFNKKNLEQMRLSNE